MLYLIGLPFLILILPATYKSMLCYLGGYLVVCTIFSNQYGLIEKEQLIRQSSGMIASWLVDIFLVFLFYVRWVPSGIINAVAGKLFMSSSVFLIISSIIVGIFAFRGINYFVFFSVDYIKHFSDMNLVKWFKKDAISVKENGCFSLILAILFFLFQGQLPNYIDVDNYGISLIVNGMYDTDNYCCFVNPVLAKMIKIVDYIIPSADGFILLMELFMFVAIWLVLFCLLSFGIHKINVCIIWLLLLAFNFSLNAFHANFTIYAGILTCIGLIGLYSFIRKKAGYFVGIISLIIFLMGSWWRINAQLLFIPFIFLVIVAEIACYGRKVVPYLKRALISIVLMIVCLGGSKFMADAMRNSDVYSESVAYNNARSQLFDYVLEDWNIVGADLEAVGISENDFNSIQDSLLADTDIITTEYMTTIYGISHQNADQQLDTLTQKMSNVWYMIHTNLLIFLQIVLLGFILLWLLLFSDCNKVRILEIILAYIGTLIIVTYFAGTGRIPDRVVQTILFGDWFVVATILFSDNCQYNISVPNVRPLLLGFMFSAAIFSYISADKIDSGFILDSLTAKTGQNLLEENQMLMTDVKYVWSKDDYNTYISNTFWQENKLPSVEFMNANITDGKWVYGQVCFNNYLASLEINNPMTALLEEDIYYVGNYERCNMVLTFLQEHYDKSIIVKKNDSIQDIPVWKFIEEN